MKFENTNQIGLHKHQAYTNQIGLYKLPQVSTWLTPGSDQIQSYFLFNFHTPKYCKKKSKAKNKSSTVKHEKLT